ncbi:low molecular weight protein-tyrosine-phosphatase [Vibrio europaeus]|uniref:low molecular weight protein-tyrosine-phosphatase n=1 Tax=Vibrio europaeus TaxID=300876 RepID=UPI00148C264F|nr:low molecular weight protein-tyrosine-phosphatase [Vibrio europaeus]MDC5819342.1 low molecular weight phosphotyrosine protein phosphatase [Vibrio europaeus]MDC5842311.1 low molecular weight phosphotyrosine protein phosphatase [Vibrio europaeus]MDC5852111.1 low molecular weight phosphotyrosine protein phosphatase [Vibrio europaeus]MDC5872104.1 low molecular weight phosphotyrosine protein phosphatase [Vibrio europaeus]NOH25005.1 low molecular weight phosphotyrosine protein phosphatase [Vibrio
MISRVLIVCSGNICRSPLAEVIFKRELPQMEFDSAGLLVEQSGLHDYSAARYSQKVANLHNLDLSCHRAKQLNRELVEWSDLILAMSHDHIDLVSELNSGATGKTLLIGQWIGVGEVNDPLGKDIEQFEHCYRTLARAIESWRSRLS